jgi:hypothetical protein
MIGTHSYGAKPLCLPNGISLGRNGSENHNGSETMYSPARKFTFG